MHRLTHKQHQRFEVKFVGSGNGDVRPVNVLPVATVAILVAITIMFNEIKRSLLK